jgi:AraC family transcriptional regulator
MLCGCQGESHMSPVGKALWFIESHFASDIALEDMATLGGVSRHHMTRAFGAATGMSIMRYVRGRRLTEAARVLSGGAPDILAVALEAGYGSHEAFTRAFREQFGVTPESVRARGTLHDLPLVEAIRMDQSLIDPLQPPRFETSKPVLVMGISQHYTCENSAGIPAQWQRFLPHFGSIPGQLGRVAYGVRYNFDDLQNFDYLCGVEVADFSRVPEGWSSLRLPERRYAVFDHGRHVSEIRRTWNTIWNQWLPRSGHEAADAPDFERYGEDFDPRTGMGSIEIWIPLQR